MAIVINGSGTVTGLAVGGLPDGTVDAGTLATNSVTAAKLEVSAITGADLPAGSVLQVVQGSSTTSTTTSSSSYVASGLSANITPSSTSSKILVFATFSLDTDVGGRQFYVAFYRGTNNLNGAANADAWGTLYAPDRAIAQCSGQQLDSPSSTSELTYSVKFKSPSGAIEFTSQGTVSYITLMEIAG